MVNRMERHRPYGPYERYVKRPLDAVVSLFGLILCSPVFLVIGLLVKARLGSPVIFSQERPGLNGKIFKLYKFRTMTQERGEDGKLLPDKDRLTDFGKLLRRSSLDELPELVNILAGDMSFVGPRPLLGSYLARYDSRQAMMCGRDLRGWRRFGEGMGCPGRSGLNMMSRMWRRSHSQAM